MSLDGGIANAIGRDWLDSAQFDTGAVRTPVLHFYQEVDSPVRFDRGLLDRLTRADRTLIRVDRLYHIDFTSAGNARAMVPALPFAPPVPLLDRKVAAVDDLVRRFLHAVFAKGGETSIANAMSRATAGKKWLQLSHVAGAR